MDATAKAAKKKQVEDKGDAAESAAAVESVEEEEYDHASGDNLVVTVLARDHRKWQIWLHEDEPLSHTLFAPLENVLGGKCILHHQSATRGNQILDRTKTPSFYGMIFDDVIFLGAVVCACD